MNFREFINENCINESYVINDDKGMVSKLSREVYVLNHINNDFKYLHLNSNSSIFEILHSRFEDYYYHLNQDIDYLCEVIAQYNSESKECCPVNFNNSPDLGKSIGLEVLESEQTLINAGIDLLKLVLSTLEKCRKLVKDNDAITSKLDETAMYWQKEYSYLLKRMTK